MQQLNNFAEHIGANVAQRIILLVSRISFSRLKWNRLHKYLVLKGLACTFRPKIITLETLTHMSQSNLLRHAVAMLLIFISSSLYSQSLDQLVSVTAKSGDSIEKLLKKYKLDSESCNLEGFCSINNLKKTSGLFEGKKYYLPIQVFNYNGRSIRTSLDIEGWERPHRIKQYNDFLKQKKLRSSSLVKSRLIWVPFHELDCPDAADFKATEKMTDYEIKPQKMEEEVAEEKEKESDKNPDALLAKQTRVSGYRDFPIFGDKHSSIALIDNSLAGKVYYLVAGHGGPDPGAIGESKGQQLCEDEYSYDVTLRLCRRLLERGATVYMIVRDPDDGLREGKYLACDQDEYCWGNQKIPLNQRKRLVQRAAAINDLYRANKDNGVKEQTALMIHIDSRSKSANTDVFFYHYPKSSSSRSVANDLHKTFKQKYSKYRRNGNYHGTVTARDLFMLRVTQPKAVFIELGNIRSPKDQKRFLLESNREAVAKWLYEGLIRKK